MCYLIERIEWNGIGSDSERGARRAALDVIGNLLICLEIGLYTGYTVHVGYIIYSVC